MHSRYKNVLEHRITSESMHKSSLIIYRGCLKDEVQKSVVQIVVKSVNAFKCWRNNMVTLYFHYDLRHQLTSLLVAVSGFQGNAENNKITAANITQKLNTPDVRIVVISYQDSSHSRICMFDRYSAKTSREPKDRDRLLWCRFLATMMAETESDIPAHPKNRIIKLANHIGGAKHTDILAPAVIALQDIRQLFKAFMVNNRDALSAHRARDADSMVMFGLDHITYECNALVAFVETYFWFRKMDELGDTQPLGMKESLLAAANFVFPDGDKAYDCMSVIWAFLDKFMLRNRELGSLLSVCAESNLIDYLRGQQAAVCERAFDVNAEGYHEIFSTRLPKEKDEDSQFVITPPCCISRSSFSDDICSLHEWDCDWNHNVKSPMHHVQHNHLEPKVKFPRNVMFQCSDADMHSK